MAISTRTIRSRALCSSAVLGLAVLTAPQLALAQETTDAQEDQGGLAEIVVTATRRAENLQEVPIAVSAVTSEALDNAGIETTSDITQIVPSVQFTRSGPSGLFFIRGVGTTNAAAGEEGANAVYVDNVYMADLGQTINYFNNVQRVEVLKGPQGTLFGRNATGGLIHIITRDPGDEYELDGEFGVSNYETVSARAYIAGPIADGLSADMAFTNYHQNEGFGRNLTRDTKNRIQDYWGVRSKIVARPSAGIKLTLAGDYFKNKDNPVGWRIADGTIGFGGCRGPGAPATPVVCPSPFVADDFDTISNDLALTKQKIYGGSLTGEVDLGFATLTSITAARKTTTDSDFDVDAGPLPIVRIQFSSGLKSLQQELRLASTDTEPLAWQIGAFYLNTKAGNEALFSGAGFPAIFRGQQIDADLETNSYAAFGEATYSITPTTKLTAGARYTTDRRTFDASQFLIFAATGVPFAPPTFAVTNPSMTPLPTPGVQQSKLKYNKLTWRLALRQEITPDISVYGSVNKGFKSGSYSLQNPLNDPYRPQDIMAYELGLKSELFDRRLRLNLAAFHYTLDDYQVRSAAIANPGSSLVLNAATVKVDGVELEFEAAPIEQLRLFGGATYLDSRYKRFGGPGAAVQAPIVYPIVFAGQSFANSCAPAAAGLRNPGLAPAGAWLGGYVTCLGDVSGNQVSNAPKFAASLGATYTMPVAETGELRFTALYAYNSGYYFEPDNIAEQDDFHLLNASIEYRPSENLGIEFWGRNITNTDYAVQKITTATGQAQVNGSPRQYGVNLKFDF